MVEAGYRYGLPLTGTMAHSWVMCFETETEAYRHYMNLYGEQAVLLIDTYDSLAAVERIIAAGLRPRAVRIDSGNLVSESRAVRTRLDSGGLEEAKILVSGDLDEFTIAEIVAANAPIDGFGVGNALSTVSDAPALGGVYKLVEVERQGSVRATLKLSDGKITYPGRKQVYRYADETGAYIRDVLGLVEAEPKNKGRELLEPVMVNGRRSRTAPTLGSLQRRRSEDVQRLPTAVRQLRSSGEYAVRRSEALESLMFRLRDSLPDMAE